MFCHVTPRLVSITKWFQLARVTTRLLLSRQGVTRRDQLAAKPKKERGRGRGRGRGGRGGRGHGHGKEPEVPQLTDAEVWEEYERWVLDDGLWKKADDDNEDKTMETEKKRPRVIQENVRRVGDHVCEAPVPSSSKPAKSTKQKKPENEEMPETEMDQQPRKKKHAAKPPSKVKASPKKPSQKVKKNNLKEKKEKKKRVVAAPANHDNEFDESIMKKILKFTKKINYQGLEWDSLKATTRDALPEFTFSKLTVYWTRSACAVSMWGYEAEAWVDVGHFSFNRTGFQGTPACKSVVAVALGLQHALRRKKCLLMLVLIKVPKWSRFLFLFFLVPF